MLKPAQTCGLVINHKCASNKLMQLAVCCHNNYRLPVDYETNPADLN